jgi:hypothetical protein
MVAAYNYLAALAIHSNRAWARLFAGAYYANPCTRSAVVQGFLFDGLYVVFS